MKVGKIEKLCMNNPIRVWVQRKIESPIMFDGIDLPTNPVCLEIGCGRGVGLLLINQHFKCKKVVGIDCDPEMIEQAKEYYANPPRWARDIPKDNIDLKVGDASNMEFLDESFDCAFSFGVFHHIKDWQKAISEVYRVLRPGGYFSIEEFFLENIIWKIHLQVAKRFGHEPYALLKEKEFRRCLEKNGFSFLKYKKERIPMSYCHAITRKKG
ncbi:MAG: class I SAM-dependent methyltransferase [Candidatus Edwardsbacteria bacterium]